MLKIVMNYVIKKMNDDTTFEELFEKDVMETQDDNINREISFLVKNHISPLQIDKLLVQSYKGW